MKELRGVYTALVTPFVDSPDQGYPIDFDSWSKLIEWQLSVGVSGLVIFGTTGESPALTKEEKLELAAQTVDQVRGRVPVIAGGGTNCTSTSIELTRALREKGVDAVLAVAPYYNKPTQEGLFLHFTALAEHGGLPVVLYNVPSRTVTSISVDTFARLAPDPRIIGIKQAVDSASELVELAGKVADKTALLAGDDPLVFSVLSVGGTGVISASANAIPEQMVAITERYQRGDAAGSLRAQQEALPAIRALFSETNPIPVKAALVMKGIIASDAVRLPLTTATPATREKLQAALRLSPKK